MFSYFFSNIEPVNQKLSSLLCIENRIVDAVFIFVQLFRQYIFQGARKKYFQTNGISSKEYISA